jgi:predicted amidohydrolase YtcJ
MTADLLLANGRVLGHPGASVIAVAGGRIAAVGGRGDARRLRARGTRDVDLAGGFVVPGLVDAHAHMDREGLKTIHPSLARCRSIGDVQRLVARLAARRPRGEWIVTMPVGTPPFYRDAPGCLAEGRWPTRADLDAAAPDHPVYVRGIWGYWNRPPVHSAANSLALRRAGVTRDTAAPRGVEIVRDATGEPTGVFVESNLIQVLEFTLMACVPRFTHAERLRALAESQRRYAARGVTAIYEGHGVAPEVLRVYRDAHERGDLRVRSTLAVSPTWDVAEADRAMAEVAAWAGGRGLGDDMLRVGGICLHWGGDADVARILHAGQPYTGWAGFVESANDPEAYRAQVALAARHALRVNTLITRCLPEVLDVWESVTPPGLVRALRWVLVHLNAVTPRDVERIRRLGAVVTTNPISYLWRSAAEEAAKADRAEFLMPHRTLARRRIPFALATDNKPADPWLAFRAVVARRDMTTDEVIGPAERLARRAALGALTAGGAWLTFAEREAGVIARGRRADLAVLDRDPLAVPLDEIPDLECRLTVVGGSIVHEG